MTRKGHWMQTYMGIKYYPYDPRPEDFVIGDIAHALSMTCRYNGHSQVFISVAQHSVLMSHCVKPKNALWALLHDAAEAYLGDLVRPVKHGGPPGCIGLGEEFKALENKTLSMIAQRFDLSWPMPDEIHEADNRMLVTESRDIMGGQIEPWGLAVEPYELVIVSWSPSLAERAFLNRYKELKARG